MVLLKEDIFTESHNHDVALGKDRTDHPIEFVPDVVVYMEDAFGKKQEIFRKNETYWGIRHSDGSITSFAPILKRYVYVDESKITIIGGSK